MSAGSSFGLPGTCSEVEVSCTWVCGSPDGLALRLVAVTPQCLSVGLYSISLTGTPLSLPQSCQEKGGTWYSSGEKAPTLCLQSDNGDNSYPISEQLP